MDGNRRIVRGFQGYRDQGETDRDGVLMVGRGCGGVIGSASGLLGPRHYLIAGVVGATLLVATVVLGGTPLLATRLADRVGVMIATILRVMRLGDRRVIMIGAGVTPNATTTQRGHRDQRPSQPKTQECSRGLHI